MKKLSLATHRFSLIELTKNDASGRYLSWLNKKETAQYITHTKADIQTLANYIEDNFTNKDCLFLGIFIGNETQREHIGNVKYERMKQYPHIATMGILIGETHWHGKGVAKEVIEASLPVVKSSLGIKLVNLGVEKDNIAAIKAYQKIGFEIAKKPHYQFDDEALEMDIEV